MSKPSSINRWRGIFLLLMLFRLETARAESNEYHIKAAFLLNFTQFVRWPAGSFSSPDAPLCIGILGEDPFGSTLEVIIHDETAQNHKLAIRRARRVEDLQDCQVIFVGKTENKHVPEILAKIDSRPVMTVSDLADFAKQGGTINFYREQSKVRFEINPASAKQSGLQINSQLLSLGRIVESSTPEKK